MSIPVIELAARARRAGLTVARKPDGQLVIRGPRQHEQLARALRSRKPAVTAIFAVLHGDAPRLDWRREPILDQPRPCVLCRRPTILIEPYDGRPCHKTCAEAAIRWGTAARLDGGRAA